MAKRPAPPSADLPSTSGFQAGNGDLFDGTDERGFFAEPRSAVKKSSEHPAAVAEPEAEIAHYHGHRDRLRAVSYTHLDVYKRQTGSCPNTGSMRGLTTPGSRIWMSEHDSPTRKYRHMLEMVEADGTVVGINTGMPNRLAEEAILNGRIPQLAGYSTIRREQKYGRNSRIDFLLSEIGRPDAYVEVKNVHFMREKGLAEFPDTATKRGAKHLEELGDAAEAGHRAVMLYLIQRNDCDQMRICDCLLYTSRCV